MNTAQMWIAPRPDHRTLWPLHRRLVGYLSSESPESWMPGVPARAASLRGGCEVVVVGLLWGGAIGGVLGGAVGLLAYVIGALLGILIGGAVGLSVALPISVALAGSLSLRHRPVGDPARVVRHVASWMAGLLEVLVVGGVGGINLSRAVAHQPVGLTLPLSILVAAVLSAIAARFLKLATRDISRVWTASFGWTGRA